LGILLFLLLSSWEILATPLPTPPPLGRHWPYYFLPLPSWGGREGQITGKAESDLAIEPAFLEGIPNVLFSQVFRKDDSVRNVKICFL